MGRCEHSSYYLSSFVFECHPIFPVFSYLSNLAGNYTSLRNLNIYFNRVHSVILQSVGDPNSLELELTISSGWPFIRISTSLQTVDEFPIEKV